MNKVLLFLTMLAGTLTAQASLTPAPSPKGEGNFMGEGSNFTYLTFETTDGAKASVSVTSDVSLSISGTTLTIGSQSFTLTNLSKMYFSTSDETATSIETIENSQLTIDDSTDIYDLQGHKVTKAQMKKGVYIVKTKQGTYKMVVR